MEQFFKRPQTLLRMREGRLGTYIDSFAKQLINQGYARNSVRYQLRLVANFSRWIQQQGVTVEEITPDHPTLYLQQRAPSHRLRGGDAFTLQRFLDFLRLEGVVAEKMTPVVQSPAERLADEFRAYLRQERALAERTVSYYLESVSRFLKDRFADQAIDLAVLCAADIVGFVERQARCLHPQRAKVMTTALRSFLQFGRYRGDINLDLAAAVPTVANWTMSAIPRFLSPDQVERVLAHCNRQTAIGRRDYAILLLLARLGLRGGEVAALTLDDMDWEAGYLTVRGKGGQWIKLPLPVDVGEAIAVYLKEGRPATTSRRLFLRSRAPVVGFRGPVAISSLVMHALVRAGIDSPRKGAHLFRHTLATQMLRQGASFRDWRTVASSEPADHSDLCQGGSRFIARTGLSLAGRWEMNTLREAVEDYLTMRRGLGFKLHGDGKGLLDFVSFLEPRGATSITTSLALEWAQLPSSAQPAEWARRLRYVRGFAQYRSAVDPRTEIPSSRLLPYRPARARPYLYTDQEIECLLEAALKLPPADGLWRWTYHCLVGLLAVSGLRISEAIGLELEDVDLGEGVLTVRGAKFGKSRLVPLHVSTQQVLADYELRRADFLAGRHSPSFFVSKRGNRLEGATVRRTFYQLSRQIGLRGPDSSSGPRLHDFRHRFAVETLLRWYRVGEDVERRLPVLATYLGHVHVSDTYWYLTACPELMGLAVKRLEQRWEVQS